MMRHEFRGGFFWSAFVVIVRSAGSFVFLLLSPRRVFFCFGLPAALIISRRYYIALPFVMRFVSFTVYYITLGRSF